MSKDMNKLLKQAQRMQSQVMKAQEEFKKQEVEGIAGGGMVTVRLNGGNKLVALKIHPEVVDPNEVEMLEDLIIAAYTSAQDKIKTMSDSTFGSLTSGLHFPGL
ncbi:MAG: YbaB/EbfC family nucleoid-associated protein [Chitinispirillaceae bacterium]|nr:YbaB/EbfC family nucleoid-associated protein [Chitinispirillaceae bacterium]